MEIIGEKINGARKRVATAITNRDKTFIRDLAQRQEDGGAHWLDVNAGTHPDREPEDLAWLVETIQAVVRAPLCLDSANPEALAEAIKAVDQTPMINSISGQPQRLEGILPLVAKHGCPVIALAMDGKTVPKSAEERLAVIRKVMAETRSAGVADERIYVDTLAMTISTDIRSAGVTLDTIRAVRTEFPQVHLTLGLSNISFGLPARGRINHVFLALAMAAGLDSAIVDPLDRQMRATILTTELLLGRDRHCLNFTRAFRAGLLES